MNIETNKIIANIQEEMEKVINDNSLSAIDKHLTIVDTIRQKADGNVDALQALRMENERQCDTECLNTIHFIAVVMLTVLSLTINLLCQLPDNCFSVFWFISLVAFLLVMGWLVSIFLKLKKSSRLREIYIIKKYAIEGCISQCIEESKSIK